MGAGLAAKPEWFAVIIPLVLVSAVAWYFLRGTKQVSTAPGEVYRVILLTDIPTINECAMRWGYEVVTDREWGKVLTFDETVFDFRFIDVAQTWNKNSLRALRNEIRGLRDSFPDLGLTPNPVFLSDITPESKLQGALARAGYDLALYMTINKLPFIGSETVRPLIEVLDKHLESPGNDTFFYSGMAAVGGEVGKAAYVLSSHYLRGICTDTEYKN
jgi:hypothetical protein